MARRIRNPFLGKAFTRTLDRMTRSAVRAGTKALKQALRPAPAKASRAAAAPKRRRAAGSAAAGAGAANGRRRGAAANPSTRSRDAGRFVGNDEPAAWTSGVAIGPTGTRRFRLYRPPGIGRDERVPLLVMLHGCGQDAEALAASSRMNRLATRERFLVLYPEQDRLANAQRCWNWFDTRAGRAQAEAAIIDAAIDQVAALHPVDRTRIALAGLSAGAGMAALMALRRPSRYAAVAMHSGVGPGLAGSSATALRAMRGHRGAAPLPFATEASEPLPPLLVIQGSADRIVAVANGVDAARRWAERDGAQPRPTRRVQRGTRRAAHVTDYRIGGRIVATLCEVEGLGHAWSGGAAGHAYSDPSGPDAARMIWAFASARFRANAAAVS